MANRMVTCQKCGKDVDVAEIKYMPKEDGNMIVVCSACSGGKTSNLEKFEHKKVEIPKKQEPVKQEPVKVKYYCSRCKFEFTFKPDTNKVLRCPYCGRDDRIEQDKRDASSLLSQASDN